MRLIFTLLLCAMFACTESDPIMDTTVDSEQEQEEGVDPETEEEESEPDPEPDPEPEPEPEVEEDEPEAEPELVAMDFTAFNYKIDNAYTTAVIDTTLNEIVISGVEYSEIITAVTYTVTDSNITVSPNPNTLIDNWGLEETLLLIRGEDTVSYTVKLPDGREELEANANTILFNPSTRKQEILIYGGDMERCQSALQTCANPEEVVEWCFSDIAFNACRVSYDKQQELVEGTKNMEFYANAIKSMQMIKAIKPDIMFWATMKSDYSGYNSVSNLPDWICDYSPNTWFDTEKYAMFLADYLEEMNDNGVAITYLSTAKEWSSIVTAARAKEVVTYLNAECLVRGIPQPLIIDAAVWSLSGGISYINNVILAGSVDLHYGFSTHNYNSNGTYEYQNFVALASFYNKPAFADETGYGGSATSGVDPEDPPTSQFREKCEIYSDGMNGEVLFELWSRNVNTESRSVYFKSGGGTAYRMRSHYIIKKYINSLAGKFYTPYNYTQFSESTDIYTMSFVDASELFICVVNIGDSDLKNLRLTIDDDVYEGGYKAYVLSFDNTMPTEGEDTTEFIIQNSIEIDVLSLSVNFINIPLSRI